jgi:hypothetical protein
MNPVREDRAAAVRQIECTMKAWRSASGAAATPTRIPQGAGAPLSAETRARMEPKLGVNLGAVRVHSGGESATAARNLGARAFTQGEDVHFAQGEFAPGTREGDKLLAHELTHVAQAQRSGIQRKADSGNVEPDENQAVSHPHEPEEEEADAVAEHVGNELEKGDTGDEKADAPATSAKLSASTVPRKIYRDKKSKEKGGIGEEDRDPYSLGPEVDPNEASRLISGVHSAVAKSIKQTSPVEFIRGMRQQFNGGAFVTESTAPAVDKAIVDWYTSLTEVSDWTGAQKPVVHPLAAGRLSNIVAATGGAKLPGSPGHYQGATGLDDPGCSLHGLGLALDFESDKNPMVMNKQLQALIQTVGGGSHKMELPPGTMGVIGKMGEGADEKGPQSRQGDAETPEQQKQFEKERLLLETLESECNRLSTASERMQKILVTEKTPDPAAALQKIKKDWLAAEKSKDDKKIAEAKAALAEVLQPWTDEIAKRKKELSEKLIQPLDDAALKQLTADVRKVKRGKNVAPDEALNERLGAALAKLDEPGTAALRAEQGNEQKKLAAINKLNDKRKQEKDPVETLEKLEKSLTEFKFVFGQSDKQAIDPGAAQLGSKGFFNLSATFYHLMATHGFYPGACYGGHTKGGADFMHFRLAESLLPPPAQNASKK